jgi:hypothetical protein
MNALALPKDFWLTVKSEIEASDVKSHLLCRRSATFAGAWGNLTLFDKIGTLAKRYLTFRPANYSVGQTYLFSRHYSSGISDEEAKQFRTDFVNWCVENNY